MEYTALYREWRPKNFEDVVGQKHITITLRNQILKNRIAHAYLFCGTRGTGKTSTAKIMAKAVNCLNPQNGEPCNECAMCKSISNGTTIDVVELDAASNNGVDKIRDIIDDVKYPPQEGKYKVYIMDEVHMLSTGAVNAFLKTLEEPPERVIFILATTDPQKLPVTILSRCQRYDFKRISSEDIFQRLRLIVEQKGVFADDNSLKLIARIADGALRDALSILDQAIAMGAGKVEYDNVVSMLGLVGNDNLFRYADEVISKNVEKVIKIIDQVISEGKDVANFTKDLINHMRNLMMVKVSANPEEVIDSSSENIERLKEQAKKLRIEEIMRYISILQEAVEESKWSRQGRIYLELASVKMCKMEYDTSNETILARLNKLEEAIKSGNISVSSEAIPTKVNRKAEIKREEVITRVKKEYNSNSVITLDMAKKAWKDILETFKARRLMVIYASIMVGSIEKVEGGTVFVRFPKEYAQSKKRLEAQPNNSSVQDVFSDVLKENVKVAYLVDAPSQNEKFSPEEQLLNDFPEGMVEFLDE